MKNEKNNPQDKDQLRNQQGVDAQTDQQRDAKLKKEQRTGREEGELEGQDFDSELEEGDDVEQGRPADKFGRTEGRQQDTTKNQDPTQRRDTDKGGNDRKY